MHLQPAQLDNFRSRLAQRAEQLRREIDSTHERSKSETHARIAEQARDTEDDSFAALIVDTNFSEVERDTDELQRIAEAMDRIQAGSYGECRNCEQEIDIRRLEVEPTAVRCIRCQELFEKTHATPGEPSL